MQTPRHMFSNTQIDTQRYLQRHIFTNTHSHRNTWTRSCTYKHRPMTYMHSDTCTQTHRDTYIDIYSQTHTHIEAQGHTHALTQTYMQTLRHLYSNIHTGTHRYIHRHIFTNTLTYRCLHSHTRGNRAFTLADHPPQSPGHPSAPPQAPLPLRGQPSASWEEMSGQEGEGGWTPGGPPSATRTAPGCGVH